MTDSTTLLPDKRQVAASFSRAAASYDSVAALQRQVGNQLLARLPADLQVASWLDLGSGTGYFSRVLGSRFVHAKGVALDIAEGMLRHARPQGGARYFVAGDAERLPLRDAGLDLIFSSLALQWCEDFASVLGEARRVLR
ncbi:MAG TPA: malonyl-[acyl-carrier protein] O-methyltransferase BioC, partial [Pseudomonas sp.]|nr:malonyl-[acyl-carrier protein] O-methyltransferase BioC [Pseudomonas sp.]